MIKEVIKLNGKIEPWNPAKINGWGQWASDKLKDRVDWSTIVIRAVQGLPERVGSQDLMRALIQSCLEENSWSGYLMAGRLLVVLQRKEMFGNVVPPTVKALQEKLVKLGLMIPLDYSDEEFTEIEKLIKHDRDLGQPHFVHQYVVNKYAIQNRVTSERYETVQFVFMRMAMTIYEKVKDRTERLKLVKEIYDHFSCNRLSAPTPNYVNMGTQHKGFASCCLIAAGDTGESLAIADYIANKMTQNSAGIGTSMITRTAGDPVRNGQFRHEGKLPYYAVHGKAVRANTQAGRGGALNMYYNFSDPEAMTITHLRNPKSIDSKRNRDMNYTFMYNTHMAKAAAKKESLFDWTLFNAPELHDAFYSGDRDQYEAMYQKYMNDPDFEKHYFDSRDLLREMLIQSYEVGTLHEINIEEVNRHTPFKEPLYSSNLCVAPETLVLTDKGHVPIIELAGTKANVWNGQEWSEVDVIKTGENQKLITVITDSGMVIDCTPYHKFYIVKNYHSKPIEVRASELRYGDKLIKCMMPVIEGNKILDKAYINGFYSGDGCEVRNQQRIYLYGEKRNLADRFTDGGNWTNQPEYGRMYKHYKDLNEKFFVPDAKYTIKSRLDWLAGVSDADGSIYRNGDNQALVISSTNYKFLSDIQYMLHTVGVYAKIKKEGAAGFRKMPLNDGSGEMGDFYCKDSWRILINSNGLYQLISLGIEFGRLKVSPIKPQREAKQFVKISAVVDFNRTDDTYCFTEPKRHMGVFNGLLTGQCVEITQPTKPYYNLADLLATSEIGEVKFNGVDSKEVETYVSKSSNKFTVIRNDRKIKISANDLEVNDLIVDGHGRDSGDIKVTEIVSKTEQPEISTCSLAAIVVSNVEDTKTYENVAYHALRMIDYCIENGNYPFPHLAFTARQRYNAGVGMMAVAEHMAKNQLSYTTLAGREEIHFLSERHMYCLIKASLKIAGERGVAPWIHRTKWVDGWTPLDTYNRNVDTLFTNGVNYCFNWDRLKAEIKAMGGIAHSSLVAHMPSESSSKGMGKPNSLYPIRRKVQAKTDQSQMIYWAAPESDNPDYHYEIAWDIGAEHLTNTYAIVQKFSDQAISADYFRRLAKDEKVPVNEMFKDFFYRVKMGVKTRYYQNSATSSEIGLDVVETAFETGCAGGACSL